MHEHTIHKRTGSVFYFANYTLNGSFTLYFFAVINVKKQGKINDVAIKECVWTRSEESEKFVCRNN